jgi:hypothetical protein
VYFFRKKVRQKSSNLFGEIVKVQRKNVKKVRQKSSSLKSASAKLFAHFLQKVQPLIITL